MTSNKKNESIVYFNLYADMEQLSSKPKFNMGNKVRISKYKKKLLTGIIYIYTPNWTEDMLTVDKVPFTNPIT